MIKNETVPNTYKMISLDISFLFTVVPLEYTIDLTIEKLKLRLVGRIWKIYCVLCTKNVHFIFKNNIQQQKDGIAMGFPLGPMLPGIFMVHLGRTLTPKLAKFMKPWKRYADDTITYIKPDFVTRMSLIFWINFMKISNSLTK